MREKNFRILFKVFMGNFANKTEIDVAAYIFTCKNIGIKKNFFYSIDLSFNLHSLDNNFTQTELK